MQLKKLTIQAFGPFKDKVVIDFENNRIDRGLLLVSGDTGAGKQPFSRYYPSQRAVCYGCANSGTDPLYSAE